VLVGVLAAAAAAARGVAVQLEVRRLWLLLVALGRGSLGLGGRRGLLGDGDAESRPLSLEGLLVVERARLALVARVSKVLAARVLDIIRVEALDVLPRVARLAVDRVSVIVREAADTLDGVGFFAFYRRLDLVRAILGRSAVVREDDGLTRIRELRRQGWGLFCHNLFAASRKGCEPQGW